MRDLVGYEADRPLLLLTTFAPTAQGGGAVIIRSLIDGNETRVVWASSAGDPASTGSGLSTHLAMGPKPWLVPPGRVARRIDDLAEAHSAGAVWAVAHGEIVPGLATFAARSSRRLHVSVHDDPAWSVAFRGRRDRALAPWLHLSYRRLLARADSIDVIGGGMRAAVAAAVGRDSIVVHRVVHGPIRANPSPPSKDRLVVGLLGSVYHRRQLEQLAAMLARASDLVGRPALLSVIGKEAAWMRQAAADADVEVEFHGHMDEGDGLEHLRQAFALYVGYPFGLRERVLRQTSFPAKVATYIQAARPLIVHTPRDSTLTPLFGRRPFTIPWLNTDVRRGAETLADAWGRPEYHASQHESAESVRALYFGSDNRDRLYGALGAFVGD